MFRTPQGAKHYLSGNELLGCVSQLLFLGFCAGKFDDVVNVSEMHATRSRNKSHCAHSARFHKQRFETSQNTCFNYASSFLS